jgi:predicted phosphoribosyltransferase
MRVVADDVIALETPSGFHAVGQWYRDFTQTTDDEVVRMLFEGGSSSPD